MRMHRWQHEHGLDDEDIKDMMAETRADFRVGNIDEKHFRRRMALLGLSPSEVDAEVRENEP